MNRLYRFPAFCVAFVSLIHSACQPHAGSPIRYEISGSTMGTSYAVTVVTSSSIDVTEFETAIKARLEQLDASMSSYDPTSTLSRFNGADSNEWFVVTTELCDVVANALMLSELTSGAFDVTVGPLVNLWGFGPDNFAGELPTDDDINQALVHTGYQKLRTDCSQPALMKSEPGLTVDLSGYAKGFATDQIAMLLQQRGVSDFLVEIGGEVVANGSNDSGEDWRIAIEAPVDTARGVHLIVTAQDVAIATSGNYRNFYIRNDQRYSHTIDPQTGKPVAHALASVTVIAADAAHADALATALMVMGAQRGLTYAEQRDIAALFLTFDRESVAQTMTSEFRQLVVE